MNPFDLLGKKFSGVELLFSHKGKEGIFDSVEEWEQQEYCVSSSDGSLELKLGTDDIVQAVFIFDLEKYKEYLKFDSTSATDSIKELFGSPINHKEQQESPYLGIIGSWERYEVGDYSLHIEHQVDSTIINKVTLTLKETIH